MSQQRGQTLNDVELQYHDSKTNTDALVATILREYKRRFNEVAQQNQILTKENEELKKGVKKNTEKMEDIVKNAKK